jgi:hypothetical protein
MPGCQPYTSTPAGWRASHVLYKQAILLEDRPAGLGLKVCCTLRLLPPLYRNRIILQCLLLMMLHQPAIIETVCFTKAFAKPKMSLQ